MGIEPILTILNIELQGLAWQSEVILVVRCTTLKLLCAEMYKFGVIRSFIMGSIPIWGS